MATSKEVTLRELQIMQVEMVNKFFEFCDQNDLNYTLIGGSLLGAIRHKGFIPWDDDVDIGMPRPDYERMIDITRKQEIAPGLTILSGDRDEAFALPFAKIIDNKTIIVSDSKEYDFDGDGLWIDVMPFDGLGNDLEEAKKIMLKERKYYKLIGRATAIPWKRRKGEKGVVGFVKCAYRQLYRLMGYKRYKKKIINLAKKYNYNESEYIAIVVWGLYGTGEIIRRDDFEQYTMSIFEDRKRKTMGCWDYYLRGIYGDYMRLPPVEKRQSPHNIKLLLK